jgi:hypothetical protein
MDRSIKMLNTLAEAFGYRTQSPPAALSPIVEFDRRALELPHIRIRYRWSIRR